MRTKYTPVRESSTSFFWKKFDSVFVFFLFHLYFTVNGSRQILTPGKSVHFYATLQGFFVHFQTKVKDCQIYNNSHICLIILTPAPSVISKNTTIYRSVTVNILVYSKTSRKSLCLSRNDDIFKIAAVSVKRLAHLSSASPEHCYRAAESQVKHTMLHRSSSSSAQRKC